MVWETGGGRRSNGGWGFFGKLEQTTAEVATVLPLCAGGRTASYHHLGVDHQHGFVAGVCHAYLPHRCASCATRNTGALAVEQRQHYKLRKSLFADHGILP